MSLYKHVQHGTPLQSCQALEARFTQKHGLLPNLAPQGAVGCLGKAEIQFKVSFGKGLNFCSYPRTLSSPCLQSQLFPGQPVGHFCIP